MNCTFDVLLESTALHFGGFIDPMSMRRIMMWPVIEHEMDFEDTRKYSGIDL